MPIAFACPACGKRFNVKDELAGKAAKCVCGQALQVPKPATEIAAAPSVDMDALAKQEAKTQAKQPAAMANPTQTTQSPSPKATAKPTREQRGANIRRNLRRWWKNLAAVFCGWLLLTVAIVIGMVVYGVKNHLSPSRMEKLGQGLGTTWAIVTAIIVLAVLLVADRFKSEE